MDDDDDTLGGSANQTSARKRKKSRKNSLPSMIGKILGAILDAQSFPREPKSLPKAAKMEPMERS